MTMKKKIKKIRYSYRVCYHLSDCPARVHSYSGGPFNSKDVREQILDFAIDLVHNSSCEVVQVMRIDEVCYESVEI